MFEHTPGPWQVFRVKDGPNKGKLLGIGDATAEGVADAYGGLWRDGREMDANADLIAAAPDLLDACLAYVKAYDETTGTIHVNDRIRAAIAKATDLARTDQETAHVR